MLHILGQTVQWLLCWLYYVSIICFIGAILGILTHTLYGVFFADAPDYSYLAAFGFLNGFKYAGVWAGGAAIVLCVIRARKAYLSDRRGDSEL